MKFALSLLPLLLTVGLAQAAEPAPGTEINALMRVMKRDGSTLIAQAPVSRNLAFIPVIRLNAADALVAANGRCAFNVKLDEVSGHALSGSVDRLYSNDTLIAQPGGINAEAGKLTTVWTQPYFYAGRNNLRVVLDADGAAPVTGWVRVEVAGTCNPVPVVVWVKPGSGDWNALYNAWGYSNYGTKQLQGKGLGFYEELASINAALTAAVKAGRIERPAWEALMNRWNALLANPDFVAAMKAIVPSKGGI